MAGTASSAVTRTQLDELARAIRRTPIIDNHAHPLLEAAMAGRRPLMSIATEAHGDAMHASATALAHLRAVRQLARVLDCGATWEAVVAAVEEKRIEAPDDWTGRCLAGIETILVDDGLDNKYEVHDYPWHDAFTRSKCKRIVRIESVATAIISHLKEDYDSLDGSSADNPPDRFDFMLDRFELEISFAIQDPDFAGFKSVICYRTGLDVPREPDEAAARKSFADIMRSPPTDVLRLQHDGLNDLLVHRTAALIAKSESRHKKPFQFHTGLGDNDISLAKASPSHLQEFIRAYPTVPIVLLHASYPFTREAGYLASVYANVYADIGEVFPFVSRNGQEAVIRQILELCPWSKIVWSTDGHWFPETYLLAVIRIRETLETVLSGYVQKGDLTVQAAIQLTRDILFMNSNRLYALELDFVELSDDEAWSAAGQEQERKEARRLEDVEILKRFMEGVPTPDFVRISWIDYTAMPRMRMIPYRKFMTLVEGGAPTDIGISKAALALLQDDRLIPGASPTGEYRLHPDFSSLRRGPIRGHINMYGEFRERDGSKAALCPRRQLIRAVELAARQDLRFLFGFEIEFVLMERIRTSYEYRRLPNDGHAWSVSRYFADPKVADLLRHIVDELAVMGIYVEQLHAESAPGQFELVLPPLPPLEAVDTLLHTREVIAAAATAAGLKFTLHPKPFEGSCGTASHVHMSIASPQGSQPEVYESFYAGILQHMRAIAALTYSNEVSYLRLQDGCWAGGRWVGWGTQNRETPLRKIEDSHWELKMFDGLANPYLALAAVLMAGTDGVAGRAALTWGDCQADPATLTDSEKEALGMTTELPADLKDALAALEKDEDVVGFLGSDVVERYVAVKRAEMDASSNYRGDKWSWIMDRY